MTPEQVISRAVEAIRIAKEYTDDIEFSCEDASRSQPEFLYRIIEAAIREGATTINIPDTVGYAVPSEFGAFVRDLREHVYNSDQAVWSVHCHNDLGLARGQLLVRCSPRRCSSDRVLHQRSWRKSG